MDEILKALAQHTGTDPGTTRTALGALMAFLKEHLPEGLSGQLRQALPDADGLAAHYEQNKAPASGGGLLGTVAGLAGKVLGGEAGEVSKLAGMLGRAGLGMGQIEAFLPKAFTLLEAHVPPDLLAKIMALVPGLGKAPDKP